jgi:hypothetical protein
MKKLGVLGIVGGAALLTAAPVSLQWSQDEVSVSLNTADARIVRAHRTYRRAAVCVPAAGVPGYGYGPYYRYTASYYSAYSAPRPYWSCYRPVSPSVRAVYWPYPPSRYSYYLAPFATVSATDVALRGR